MSGTRQEKTKSNIFVQSLTVEFTWEKSHSNKTDVILQSDFRHSCSILEGE